MVSTEILIWYKTARQQHGVLILCYSYLNGRIRSFQTFEMLWRTYCDVPDSRTFLGGKVMREKSILIVIVVALTITGNTFANLSDGLVAYYPFYGNANDESGNGHDGTVFGATLTSNRFGTSDSAYFFDGIDDYINVDYTAAFQLPVITVSAWILPSIDLASATSVASVATRGEDINTDRAAFSLYVNPPTSPWGQGLTAFYEDAGDGEQVFDTNIYPQIGIWTHLAASRAANGTLSIYINGSLVGDQWFSTPAPASNCFQDFLIGAYWYRPTAPTAVITSFFTGAIDDVLIYNRALSDDEIEELANLPSYPVLLLEVLAQTVFEMNIQNGISNSFDAKLDAALNALSDVIENNNVAAVNALEALENAVEAQRDVQITNDQANILLADAQYIIELLT